MKKIILQSFIGVFCFAIMTSCSKEVKTPYNKTTTAAKAAPAPVTQTAPAQSQSSHTCGSQSGSGSGSQSGTYSNGGY